MDFEFFIPIIVFVLLAIFITPLFAGELEAKEILVSNGGAPIIRKDVCFAKNEEGFDTQKGVIEVGIKVKYLFWYRTSTKEFYVTDEVYHSYEIGDFFYISDLSK